MMEVFAGFLEHTDHQSDVCSTSWSSSGELDNTLVMVISDNGASAEGGPHGSVNENLFFNNVPETLEENLKAIDELGGPKYFNHYPWGWAWAGNTPFRRWKRETYRGGTSDPFIVHWPEGHQGQGARSATSTRTSSTWCRRCSRRWDRAADADPRRDPVADPGRQFAHTFNDAKAPTRTSTQYFEMMGHRSHLSRRLARRVPVPGPSFTEAGMGFGEMPITEEKLRELDAHGLGALPRGRGLLGDQEPRRPAPRQADRDDRALVRRGRQVRRAADRQPRHGASLGGAAAARRRSQALRLLPGHVGGSEQDRRARAQPHAQHDRDGDVSRMAPKAFCSRRAARRAAIRSTSRTTRFTTPTTSSACSSFHLATQTHRARGTAPAALRVRADGRSRPGRTARERRRACSSTSTDKLSAEGDLP